MSGSIKPCLFCGSTGGQLTNEDVYPKWLRKALGLSENVKFLAGPEDQLVRDAPTLELKLRHVCADCNHGWMSKLEEAFRSRMGHLLTQGTAILNRTDQAIVAAWGIKTWYLLIPAVRHMQKGFRLNVPVSHYRWIMQRHTPPPLTQIWIGGVDALPAQLISFVNVLPVWDGPNSQRGAAGIFSIGRLLFFIYSPTTHGFHKLGIRGDLAGRLIPIWGIEEESVTWPPRSLFSAAELDALYPNGGVIRASSSS